MDEILLISLLVSLGMGFLWGSVAKSIMSNKGYPDWQASPWFWWGFFFGWIPVIIAATKPEMRTEREPNPWEKQTTPVQQPKAPVMIDSASMIHCPNCGHEQRANRNRCFVCSALLDKEELDMGTDTTNGQNAKNRKKSAMDEQSRIGLLKSYKELLDSGIITQEDFDEKKAELLK